MGRNHIAQPSATPPTPSLPPPAGYNFRRLLAWLVISLRAWLAAIIATAKAPLDNTALAQSAFFADDYIFRPVPT